VLSLTESAVALGITVALQFAPLLVGGLWAGVLVERGDRRRILLCTQIAAGITATVLAVTAFLGITQLWMIYVLAFALGVVTAIDNPARRVFLSELVPMSDLANAVSLNSAVFTLGRVVGPAVAGVVIAAAGTGWCFLANAISYAVAVAAFLAIRVGELEEKERVDPAPGQVREGLRYAWRVPELRAVLAMSFVVGMLAWNYQITLSLFSERVFDGNAATFGALFAVLSFGSVVGALVVAQRNRSSLRLVTVAVLTLGIVTTLVAFAPSLPWAFVCLVPMGMTGITFVSLAQALLQLHADVAFRARVMAIFGVVFLGSTPVGGPIIGAVADTFGPRSAMATGALGAFIAAGIGWRTMRRTGRATDESPTTLVSRVVPRVPHSVEECSAASSSPASLSPLPPRRSLHAGTNERTTPRSSESVPSNPPVSTPSPS